MGKKPQKKGFPRKKVKESPRRNQYTNRIYLILSLKVFPALNFTTLAAGMLIFSPVRGLRPSRAALVPTLKVPKPTSVILSPSESAAEIAETKMSIAFSACALVSPLSY